LRKTFPQRRPFNAAVQARFPSVVIQKAFIKTPRLGVGKQHALIRRFIANHLLRSFTMAGAPSMMPVPSEKLSCRRWVNPQKKCKTMGD